MHRRGRFGTGVKRRNDSGVGDGKSGLKMDAYWWNCCRGV